MRYSRPMIFPMNSRPVSGDSRACIDGSAAVEQGGCTNGPDVKPPGPGSCISGMAVQFGFCIQGTAATEGLCQDGTGEGAFCVTGTGD